jgi:DNA polymerase III subunit alpha
MTTNDFKKKFSKIEIPIHGVRLPEFEISNEEKREYSISEDVDNLGFLTGLCRAGFKKLKLEKDSELYNSYVARVKYELAMLDKLSFVDYMLIVWKVINYCELVDIPTGAGRGSAAGSLVLFLIGVTKIDPIKYGLYFERFISETRAKKKVVDGVIYLDGELMCDIDVDVCYYNRQKVIKYLEEELFPGRTSKISTFNTLQGKLLIKECGKIVASKQEWEVNEVSDLIEKVHGNVEDIAQTYETNEKFKAWADKYRDAYDIALKLRGLIKNKSVHASAILITYDKIENSLPMETTSGGDTICCYDMTWATLLNLKLDLLGLRNVSVVHDVCKNLDIKAFDIDIDDPIIYGALQQLDNPEGIFQVEAPTVYRSCLKIRPKNLEHLSGLMAVARPGAFQFVDDLAKYTEEGVASPLHPFFDEILEPTGGVCLYQEQLMRMANKMGFSLDESELLRRIVGKKKLKEIPKWKKKIEEKVKENNLDPAIGDIVWKIAEDSASYSFNKSHSISYAYLAAQTLFLKFKYPREFFLALLKMSRFEPNPVEVVTRVERELSDFKLRLLPPHILKSDLEFVKEGDDIRYGLLSIRGVSDKSAERLQMFIEKMDEVRHNWSNKFQVFQGSEDAGIPLGILCALIQAGALERKGSDEKRTRVVLEAQLWKLLTVREKKYCMLHGEAHDYNLHAMIKSFLVQLDEKGRPIIKESRMETIKKKYEKYKLIYLQNNKSEMFTNWYYERHLLGYSYSGSLRAVFAKKEDNLVTVHKSMNLPDGEGVKTVGIVTEALTRTSKAGNRYFQVNFSDETGETKCMVFDRSKKEYKNGRMGLDEIQLVKVANEDKMPQKGNIVIIRGTKGEDIIFGNNKTLRDGSVESCAITTQDNQIYTRLSDLEKNKKT